MSATICMTFIRSKDGEVIEFEWEDRHNPTYVTMTLLAGARELIIGNPALPSAMRNEEFVLELNKRMYIDREHARHIWNQLVNGGGWTATDAKSESAESAVRKAILS